MLIEGIYFLSVNLRKSERQSTKNNISKRLTSGFTQIDVENITTEGVSSGSGAADGL